MKKTHSFGGAFLRGESGSGDTETGLSAADAGFSFGIPKKEEGMFKKIS